MKLIDSDNQLIESGPMILDIKQYAKSFGISETTVRTRIRENQVDCYKQNNKWLIKVDKNQLPIIDNQVDSQLISDFDAIVELIKSKDDQISQLKETIEHLQSSLTKANDLASQQNAIIMNQTLMIKSKKTSVWNRVKSFFTEESPQT